MKTEKLDRFSYSRLDVYNGCGWKYKLRYEDKHYFDVESIAINIGVLVHWIEQRISQAFIAGEKPDYQALLDDYWNCNIPKKNKYDREGGIYGINIIKEKFANEYYAIDKNGGSYAQRCQEYAEVGIYRQEHFLEEHPDIEIVDVEKYFEIMFNGYLITGYIDRIMHYKNTDRYIIDDMKTKAKPFDDKDLTTPLQHVIYSLALEEWYGLDDEDIECYYDLPLINMRQAAGTKGFMKRGKTKMTKLFDGIKAQDWEPHPSPLCAFCDFGGTNPNQPVGGKHLCPYYSLWKPDNKTYEVLNKWEGFAKHDEVMDRYLTEQCTDLDDDELLLNNNSMTLQDKPKKKYDFEF